MNDSHDVFMREAIALSQESVESGGGPCGTVIVKDGSIIARGINRVTVWNDPTAHGEIVAIREACRKLGSFHLDGCTLYTNCEPCPMCLGAIYWSHLSGVYFANTREDAATIGFDDVLIYSEMNHAFGDRRMPFHQIMRDEAIAVFQTWARKVDKVRY
ncbi:MAG: nucleoside deaminase [Bacteroidetes bacterium]|nr:nucleoside deaminase [Bacteroidota bacterium]